MLYQAFRAAMKQTPLHTLLVMSAADTWVSIGAAVWDQILGPKKQIEKVSYKNKRNSLVIKYKKKTKQKSTNNIKQFTKKMKID